MKKKRLLAALLAVSLTINMMPEYTKASEAESISDSTSSTSPVLTTEEAVMEVSEEIEKLYEDTDLEKAAESEFGTCNLIVSLEENEQEQDFDTCGAEQTVSIGGGLYLLSYPDKRTAKAAWKKFQGMEGILFAEPDAVLESEDVPESGTQKETESSDVPDSGTQSEITPGEITAGETQKPVLIAVLDTGADMDDALLAPYLVTTEETQEDDNGHGTRVAGFLVRSLMAQGLESGRVQLLPVKAADENGRCTVLQLYLAIRSAIDAGADLVNISMGTKSSSGSALLAQAAKEAEEAGVILVTSAGNDGADVMGSSPSDIGSVVTVGSVTKEKEHSAFSNCGQTLDCVSYGEGLLWQEEAVSGTSYAAALVSAALAGGLAEGSIGTPAEADAYIREKAEDLGDTGWDEQYGYGLIASYVPEFLTEEENGTEETETDIKSNTAEEAGDSGTVRRAETRDTYNAILNDLLILASAESRQAAADIAEGTKTEIKSLMEEGVQDGTLFSDGARIEYRACGREAVDAAAGALEVLLADRVLGNAPQLTTEEALGGMDAFLEALTPFLQDDPLGEVVTIQATEKTVSDTAGLAALADDGKDYIVKLSKSFTLTGQIVIKNGTKLHLISSGTTQRTITLGEAFRNQQLSAFVLDSDGNGNTLYLGARANGSYSANSKVTIDGAGIPHGGFLVYNGEFKAGNTAAKYNSEFYMYKGTVLQNNNTRDKGGWTSGPTGSAVCNYGYMTMYGGTIQKNTFSKSGSGVIGNGGAIANYHKLTISGGTITGNSADQGGAIFVQHTRLLASNGKPLFADAATGISGCTIHANDSIGNGTADPYGHGGGICVTDGSAVSVSGCSIYNNSAYYGGGIYNTGSGALTVTDTSLYGNTGTYTGGAILNDGGTLTLNKVRVYQNSCTGVSSHPAWAGGVASIKKGTVNAAITISSGNTSWFYDNDGYSIQINCGTLTLGSYSLFGFSAYDSLSSYQRTHEKLGSGVSCTGGTVSVEGAVRMLVPENATGFYTNSAGTLNIGSGAGAYLLCKSAAYGIHNEGRFTSGSVAGGIYPYSINGTGSYGIANTGSGSAFLRGLVCGNYTIEETAQTANTGTALNTPGFACGIYNSSDGSYSTSYPYAVVLSGTTADNGTVYCGLVQYAANGLYNTEKGSVLVGLTKIVNSRKTSDGKKGNGIYNAGTLRIRNVDAEISGCQSAGIYNTGNATFRSGTVMANAGRGVYNTGTFVIEEAGAVIKGNGGASSGSGAGIYNAGTVTMQNGSITGNLAGTYGAGLMNKAGAVFTMTGGDIGWNLCEQNTTDTVTGLGGGIYNEGATTDKDGNIIPAGIVNLYAGYIFGNNDYGIRNKGTLNLATQATPASGSQYVYMGISSYTSPTVYTVRANTLGNICSYAGGTITIGKADTKNAGALLVTNDNTNIYTTATLTASGNTAAPSQVVLLGSGTGIENVGGNVTLDTGIVISGATRGIRNTGGTVTVKGGTIGNGETGIVNNNGSNSNGTIKTGSVTMTGGAITGNTGNGVENNGNLALGGGTIGTNSKNGIANSSTGNLWLYGGTVSGNDTGIENAGKAYLYSDAKDAKKTASITGNKTHGVYQNGTFCMSGAAKVDSSNDVCLPVNKVITVNGKLTTDGVVAKIFPVKKNAKNEDVADYVLARKVATTTYTGGVGSQALFSESGKQRFLLKDEGILRPGDYMSTEVLKQENHSEINGVDIVISEKYDITYEKNIDEKDVNGNQVDVAVSNFPSTQGKYWCENLKLPNGTDTYTDPSVSTEPYSGYYVFRGWNSAADGSGKEYSMPEVYKENAATTIYAQWMKKIKVAYIGNGQSEGEDFIDDGIDGTGIALSGDYTFDSNVDTATASEHFTKSEEVEAFTNEETGEVVKQEVTSTVVGWKYRNDETSSDRDYSLGEIEAVSSIYEMALTRGAVTVGAPNSDFGAYPKDENQLIQTAGQMLGASGMQAEGGTEFQMFGAPADTTPYVNLYAVWDRGPTIEAYDLYYTLEEAQSTTDTQGITMAELLSRAVAEDEEDGTLPAGADVAYAGGGKTSFIVSDYAVTDFTGFTASGSVTVNYRAIDTAGNITNQMITVHIVDTTGEKVDKGNVRFISEKYLNTLDADSIWVVNPEYNAKLRAVLANKKVNTEHYTATVLGQAVDIEKPGTGTWTTPPEEVWEFTHEEVLAVQQYVDDHGIGNSEEADGLQGFLTQFASCKQ